MSSNGQSGDPPQRKTIRIKLKERAKSPCVELAPEQVVEEDQPEIVEDVQKDEHIESQPEGLEMQIIGFESKDEGQIYFCWKCDYPVVRYGKIIPCRHVFCMDCASTKRGWRCPRCKEYSEEIKEISRGPLYICVYGGENLQDKGSCLRGYESWTRAISHVKKRHDVSSKNAEPFLVEAFFASDEKPPAPQSSVIVQGNVMSALMAALSNKPDEVQKESEDPYDSVLLGEDALG